MNPHRDFKILCVDDDLNLLRTLGVAFRQSGYVVETAQNAFIGQRKLRRAANDFQLIVTDIRMPGMDGFAFIEQARLAGYSGPFLVYAGAISAIDRRRFRDLGVSRIVTKPVPTTDLIEAIDELQTAA